jgi:outer membrane protein assembly factor BamB
MDHPSAPKHLERNQAPRLAIRRWVPLLILGALTLTSSSRGADWPQWRGPNRDGVATGSELPAQLPAALHKLWKVEVGEGQSSPIVVGQRVFILARQGEEEVVLALDASTGKELWRHAYAVQFVPSNAAIQYGPGPKSTMLADGGSVYSFGIRSRLLALDAKSGAVRWEKSFEDIYDPPYPEWGAAASPLLEGGLLIVPIGNTTRGTGEAHIAQGALVAYDKTTGKEVWRADGAPAYASPMAFTHGGVRQIVTQGDEAFFGVRASDGELLWSTEFETAFDQNSVTTILYDGTFILSGYQWGTAAIRVEPPKGDGAWNVSEVWKTTKAELYMDSPVRVGDHLYFRSNKRAGSFVSLDPATGEIVWQSPGRWAAYSSVIAVGDRLLALTDGAELKVIAADPAGYQELASWDVATSTTWAHLALSGSRLYVKDEEHLASFDLAAARYTTKTTDRLATRTAAPTETAGRARGSHDTEAVQTMIRQMLDAMAAGDMERMFRYLGEDFRSYSGASKEVFSQYLGDTTGTKVESDAMRVEWQGATASVSGVRWISGDLNFGLPMLVDERDGEWRVTFMDFDTRDLNR